MLQKPKRDTKWPARDWNEPVQATNKPVQDVDQPARDIRKHFRNKVPTAMTTTSLMVARRDPGLWESDPNR